MSRLSDWLDIRGRTCGPREPPPGLPTVQGCWRVDKTEILRWPLSPNELVFLSSNSPRCGWASAPTSSSCQCLWLMAHTCTFLEGLPLPDKNCLAWKCLEGYTYPSPGAVLANSQLRGQV